MAESPSCLRSVPTQTGKIEQTEIKLAFNTRKCFYGMALLSICDARKRITWCRVGAPGSAADSRACKESAWYRRQTGGGAPLLHKGHLLLGYGGLALEVWLLKSFPRAQLTDKIKLQNKILC